MKAWPNYPVSEECAKTMVYNSLPSTNILLPTPNDCTMRNAGLCLQKCARALEEPYDTKSFCNAENGCPSCTIWKGMQGYPKKPPFSCDDTSLFSTPFPTPFLLSSYNVLPEKPKYISSSYDDLTKKKNIQKTFLSSYHVLDNGSK